MQHFNINILFREEHEKSLQDLTILSKYFSPSDDWEPKVNKSLVKVRDIPATSKYPMYKAMVADQERR